MNFSEALRLIVDGYKVSRKGWHASGQFLYVVSGNKRMREYTSRVEKSIADENGIVQSGAFIMMYTAEGEIIPWVASHTDLLSRDWYVV